MTNFKILIYKLKLKSIYGIIFLLISFFPKTTFSALKLNEIYPAPNNEEYEWVEIYNDEEKSIDLTGYYLTDATNKKLQLITNSISPFGFIIATASSGILNNDGDTVKLINPDNETIESISYSGSFSYQKGYLRCPDGGENWFISTFITKNSSNETACLSLNPTPTIISTVTETPLITPNLETTNTPPPIPPTETLTPTPKPTPVSYDNIYLTEAMVYPLSGENEWVEIYNGNDFSVSLTNWYLDDLENSGSSPKIFSLEIAPQSYGVFELSSSMFNNSGDNIRLLDFNKSFKDGFEYSDAHQGKSYGRISFDSDNFCLQEPTKGTVNNSCLNPTATHQPTRTSTPTPQLIKNTTVTTPLSPPFKPSLANQYTNIKLPSPIIKGEILGITNKKQTNQNKILIKWLSFLSSSYSLLTIFSILVKIKKRYEESI